VLRAAVSAAIVIALHPATARAAQPSPFSPAPDPAAPTPARAPAPGPAVPPRAPDATSAASPPVADAGSSSPRPAPTAQAAPVAANIDAAAADDGGGDQTDVPRFALGAGGHVAFATGPAVAVGVHVSGEVATGRWSLGLEGRYDLPASARTTQGGTARTTLLGGAFVPCIRAKGTWACGVVMASRVASDASELGSPNVHDSALFLGIGARLAMHLSLPLNFALRIGGEVLAHPVAYELVVNGHRVFRSSVVSTTLGPTLVRAF
jgi:hypothetical protein